MTLQGTLERRGVRFRQTGDKVHLCCPFCVERGKPSDTKFRLCVHAKDGWGRCMHCDWARRTAIVAVLKRLGINDTTTSFGHVEQPGVVPVVLPEDFTPLWNASNDELDQQARDYILGRGVTERQLRRYNIGVSYTKPWSHRIVFPVYMEKRLKCINARDFTGHRKPKYLLSKGDKCLAYFDTTAHTCVLSEGVIKALRIEQTVSLTCSASLLGHDLTDIQLGQIQRSECKVIVLYPDTDLVGRRGFIKIADKLCENWKGEVAMVWPVPGAADDLPLRELRKVFLCNTEAYTPRLRQRILLQK